MQTYTERITTALRWQSVKLPNGAYRIQNVSPLERALEAVDLTGFKNCTDCGVFVDQLECVRGSLGIDTGGLWIGLVNRQPNIACAEVITVLWEI